MKRGAAITSRIGKRPVDIPEGVTAIIEGGKLTIASQSHRLHLPAPEDFEIQISQDKLALLPRQAIDSKNRRIGLYRALIANMVAGVVKPFVKELQLIGTGFRAEVVEGTLVIRAGYSHPIELIIPSGLTAAVEKNTVISLASPDKALVGMFAAKVKAVRSPDPYKGRGIRYLGEQLTLKPGKAAKAVGGAKVGV